MNVMNHEHSQIDLNPVDMQLQQVDQAGWMITYLDVFILTAALFASLLAMKPAQAPIEPNALSALLPQSVEMQLLEDGGAALNIGSSVLFGPSEASLREEGAVLINQLIPIIQETNDIVIIEGHTDSVPINTPDFPSNWELGGARAMSVLHFLVAQGVDESRLRMISFADTQPLLPDTSETNRQKNRRVSIVLKGPV